MGCREREESVYKGARSTAMRSEMRAKSTAERALRGALSKPGHDILRCVRLVSSENAATKAGTFVAAWKRGGYCLTRRSCISHEPYFGALSFAGPVWGFCICGSYVNFFSAPVSGQTIGGRKVSGVCGMWKVKVLTWRPIRDSASMRAGFEKVEALKVEVMVSNRGGAARDEKSWHTRRRLARSSDSMCSSRLSRH